MKDVILKSLTLALFVIGTKSAYSGEAPFMIPLDRIDTSKTHISYPIMRCGALVEAFIDEADVPNFLTEKQIQKYKESLNSYEQQLEIALSFLPNVGNIEESLRKRYRDILELYSSNLRENYVLAGIAIPENSAVERDLLYCKETFGTS